jgi:hypothetical protein
MTIQQNRRIQALGIVCQREALVCGKALDPRIVTMRFSEVVRQVDELNAAGLGNLARCCKGLRQDGRRHEQTYRLLEDRLKVTIVGAAHFLYDPFYTHPTLSQARAMLSRVEARDHNGMTALMRAAQSGNGSRVRALIAAGADLNAQAGSLKFTAMHFAVTFSHFAVLKQLCDAGADMHHRGAPFTVLQLVVASGQRSAVADLLHARVDPDIRDARGRTSLMTAAMSPDGRVPIAQYLIEMRADPNAKADNGQTALNIAESSEMCDLLTSYLPKQQPIERIQP